MKKWLYVVMMMAMTAMILSGCGSKKKVDCEQLIEVTYKGFNGSAKIEFQVNEKYLKDREITDKLFPDLKRNDAKEELENLFKELTITADKTEKISNGDKIEIEVTAEDSEVLEEYKLSLANTKFTVEVKKLGEGTMVDPFEKLQVTYRGFDTKGYFRVNEEDVPEYVDDYGMFSVSYDQNGSLKNGDVLTVKYELFNEEKLLNKGYAISVFEKDYKVEGLEPMKEVNPFDCINVTFSGYDGSARLSWELMEGAPDALFYGSFEFSKKTDISKGEEIQATYKTGSVNFAEYGIIITETEKTYKAEDGITEYEAVDAFPEGLIVIEGTSPMAELTLDKSALDSKYSSYISYEVEGAFYVRGTRYYVANDSEITIRVKNPDNIKRIGYSIKEESKTIKVKDLRSYYVEGDDVAPVIDLVIPKVEEMIKSDLVDHYNSGWSDTLENYKGMEFVSYQLYTLNEDNLGNLSSGTPYSILYTVFRVNGDWKNDKNDHVLGVWVKGVSNKDGKDIQWPDAPTRLATSVDKMTAPSGIYLNRYDAVDAECSKVSLPEAKKNLVIYSFSTEIQKIIDEYFDRHPEDAAKYNVKYEICEGNSEDYQTALQSALQTKGAVDLFATDLAYTTVYTRGAFAQYVANYEDLGIEELAKKINDGALAPFTLEVGKDANGDIRGLSYQSTGGAFIYRRSVAKKIFGTDDPEKIAEIIGAGSGEWDKFMEAAAELKAQNVYMLSGSNLWHVFENGWSKDGKLVIGKDKEKFLELYKQMVDNGYCTDSLEWNTPWYDDMQGEKNTVFGFFGPAWFINFTLSTNCTDEDDSSITTYGDWAICEAPKGFFWGGTWVHAAKNTKNQEIVAKIIEWITLDTTEDGLQYLWANGECEGQEAKDEVASSVVMEKANGTLDFLGGQDMFPIFIKAGEAVNGTNVAVYDADLGYCWMDLVRQYANDEIEYDEVFSQFKAYAKDTYGLTE